MREYPPFFVQMYQNLLKHYFKVEAKPLYRFQVRLRIDVFIGNDGRDKKVELFLPVSKDIRIVLVSRRAKFRYLLLESGKYYKYIRNREWTKAIQQLDHLIRYMLLSGAKIVKEYTLDEKIVRSDIDAGGSD